MLERIPEYKVAAMFPDRWSPRAFEKNRPLFPEQVFQLFEAMRWSPSSYNEQPWFVVYSLNQDTQKKWADLLFEGNRIWAERASMLCFLGVRRFFEKTGEVNPHAEFDGGAAWMSLALQARRMGLYAHAMAGFDLERTYKELQINGSLYHLLIAIAIGYKASPDVLPEFLMKQESPNSRHDIHTFAFKDKMVN